MAVGQNSTQPREPIRCTVPSTSLKDLYTNFDSVNNDITKLLFNPQIPGTALKNFFAAGSRAAGMYTSRQYPAYLNQVVRNTAIIDKNQAFKDSRILVDKALDDYIEVEHRYTTTANTLLALLDTTKPLFQCQQLFQDASLNQMLQATYLATLPKAICDTFNSILGEYEKIYNDSDRRTRRLRT